MVVSAECNDSFGTIDGLDLEDKRSPDEKKRKGYERRALLVWRYMHRSILDNTVTGQSVAQFS